MMNMKMSPWILVLGFAAASGFAGQGGKNPVPPSADKAVPLSVGAKVPNSDLRGLNGKQVRLWKALGGKPTVLVFYRGGWCPFCNMHLADLAKVVDQIQAKGYQVIAISPDSPEELRKSVEKHKLTYSLYSNSSADALRKFGVAFQVDDQTFTMYRDKYHIDLEKSSGQKHHILPVPSVFLIDKTGKIIFAHSNPDYRVRLKGEEILDAVSKH